MEKKNYDIPGLETLTWYQKRCSAAQWQALLSHAFEVINPGLFLDERGQVDTSPNPMKILAVITQAQGKMIGEYFFGSILIPDGEVFAYDQILPRGRLIMSIDDPDVFLPLVKEVWADFLSANEAWMKNISNSFASPTGGRKRRRKKAISSSPKAKGNTTGSSGGSADPPQNSKG